MKLKTERWNDIKGMSESLEVDLPDTYTQVEIEVVVNRFLVDPNVSKVECGDQVWYGSFVNPMNVL